MAVAFELPREPGQDQVDHEDGNPSNNLLANLRWASGAENIRHSYATNAARASSAGKQAKPVKGRACRAAGRRGRGTVAALERRLGRSPSM